MSPPTGDLADLPTLRSRFATDADTGVADTPIRQSSYVVVVVSRSQKGLLEVSTN